MPIVTLGQISISLYNPALACDCEHDSCFVGQNNPDHYDYCNCPKVEGKIALEVSPIGDNSWDSGHWSHMEPAELLQGIDRLRSLVAAEALESDY